MELERMRELIKLIEKYNYYYYTLDQPVISDYEYDKLYDELVALEKSTGVTLENSPTTRVGDTVLEGFEKKTHKIKLFSLDKVNNFGDLQKWVLDVKKHYKNATFDLEYKYDGLKICLTYKNGLLESAVTRGNGLVGEDVTKQVKTIKSIPLSIDYKKDLILQGEGMMFLSDLEKYNKTYPNEPLKNARNAVAGAIRNLDPKETAKRNLNLILYDILYIEDKDLIKKQSDAEKFLLENKFKHFKGSYFKDFDKIENAIKELDKKRKALDFLVDGAVIKINEFDIRNELGETSKFPRWAMAFKFEAEEISTRLIDIIWQVGRSGKVTPTGILEPVTLAGALISRATLNNYADITRKQLKLPCRVFIRRSNEVIPEVLGLAELEENSMNIIKPNICPCCGSKLIEKGPNIYCPNFDCPERVKSQLSHFVSKEGMNIEGVSDSTIEAMYDTLNVRSGADLYDLTKDDLYKLESFKDKKVDSYLSFIEKSKNVYAGNFLYALSIPNVGKKTIKDLLNYFGDLDTLKNASIEDIMNVYQIGDVVANDIYTFFKDERNISLINNLFAKGIKIYYKDNTKKDEFWSGKKVVLTGTLTNYTRNEATELLENMGAQVLSNVSAKCDYVIYGENAGSKLTKAKELRVNLLTEKEFIDLIVKD